MNNFEIKPINPTKLLLKEYLALLRASMENIDGFSLEYLEWLYCLNPDGKVLGYDAWCDEQLVAHYACIPRRASYQGETTLALLSLNTATHPKYRKLGLFKQLALKTYEEAKLRGFKFVIGVGNNHSTPGFLKHLGFDLISPLSVEVGFGSLLINSQETKRPKILKFDWNTKQLQWRLSRPSKKVALKVCGDDRLAILAKVNSYLTAYAEIPVENFDNRVESSNFLERYKIRLFVGLLPDQSRKAPFFFGLPDFLRPAPLFLIFRGLDHNFKTPKKGDVFFTFIDFDVF